MIKVSRSHQFVEMVIILSAVLSILCLLEKRFRSHVRFGEDNLKMAFSMRGNLEIFTQSCEVIVR